MRTYRAQKSALTRATNSGEPSKVIAECQRFFNEYEYADQAYPDAARDDALNALRRKEGLNW